MKRVAVAPFLAELDRCWEGEQGDSSILAAVKEKVSSTLGKPEIDETELEDTEITNLKQRVAELQENLKKLSETNENDRQNLLNKPAQAFELPSIGDITADVADENEREKRNKAALRASLLENFTAWLASLGKCEGSTKRGETAQKLIAALKETQTKQAHGKVNVTKGSIRKKKSQQRKRKLANSFKNK